MIDPHIIVAAAYHFPTYLGEPFWNWGYQFWSGIEGAIQAFGEKLIYAVVIGVVWWRRHNCHERGCWRVNWHGVEHPDHEHPVCKHHHPDHHKYKGPATP